MKKLLLSLAVAGISGLALAQEASAPAEKCALIPSVSASVEYSSRYMSDGNIVNPKSMLIGDLTLSWNLADNYGLYADIWVATDINGYNSGVHGDPEEIDYCIGGWYTVGDVPGVKSLTFDLSYSYWDYPKRLKWQTVGETQNKLDLVVTTGSFEVNEKFSWQPGIKIAWDYENGEWQVKTFVTSSYAICDRWTLNNEIDLFWQNSRWTWGTVNKRERNEDGGKDYQHDNRYSAGFTTLVFSADLMYKINDNFTVGPFAKVSAAVRNDVRNGWDGKNNANHASGFNNVWGIALKASF